MTEWKRDREGKKKLLERSLTVSSVLVVTPMASSSSSFSPSLTGQEGKVNLCQPTNGQTGSWSRCCCCRLWKAQEFCLSFFTYKANKLHWISSQKLFRIPAGMFIGWRAEEERAAVPFLAALTDRQLNVCLLAVYTTGTATTTIVLPPLGKDYGGLFYLCNFSRETFSFAWN